MVDSFWQACFLGLVLHFHYKQIKGLREKNDGEGLAQNT
jgi:hypothetical protein